MRSMSRFNMMIFSVLLTGILLSGCGAKEGTVNSDAASTKSVSSKSYETKDLFQADPTVYEENGIYYLYGTNEGDAERGFKVYTSKDAKLWMEPEDADWLDVQDMEDNYALKKKDAFGNRGFWAPQVFKYKDSYYMAYTADEQIAIAKSSSPLGPFTQTKQKALFSAATHKTIDPFVFFDSDGQIYLYYVKQNGGNNLYVTKLNDDLSVNGEESDTACIKADRQWENTEHADWPVTEGPTVLEREGTYYLFYSANDFRSKDYAVGYATSDNPLGPWEKQDEPIISRNTVDANGPGHGDIFIGENDELYYVLHTHNSDTDASPRRTALVKLKYTDGKNDEEGTFSVDKDSFEFMQYARFK